MGDPVEDILARLDEERVLEEVERLVAIPSVSGDEDAISSHVARELVALGLEVTEQEVLPGRRNVLGALDTGHPGPTLLFNGHLDTLPIPGGWEGDPFRPRRHGGRLIGAEVNNMKGAVGAMIGCLAALREDADKLEGRVVLSAVIGECDTLGLGTTHMLAQGFSADCAINGEPTDLKVMTAHGGVCQLRLVVEGRSAHVSQRADGVNAIENMVGLLNAVDEAALEHQPHPDFPGLPTLNVGVMRGGQGPSMLAQRCEAEVDVRTVPGMTPEGVKRDLEAVIGRLKGADPDFSARVELFGPPRFVQEPPFHIAVDAPIVRTVAEAHRRVVGQAPEVGSFHPLVFYGTDSAHLMHAGIPTVIYGPGRVEDINVPKESIATRDLIQAARVYLVAAHLVCGRGARGLTT